jgi:hypothetical protein
VTSNKRVKGIEELEETLTEALRPFWEMPARVLSLVDHWMHDQAIATV